MDTHWTVVPLPEVGAAEPEPPTLEERVAAVESEVTDVKQTIDAIFGEVSA